MVGAVAVVLALFGAIAVTEAMNSTMLPEEPTAPVSEPDILPDQPENGSETSNDDVPPSATEETPAAPPEPSPVPEPQPVPAPVPEPQPEPPAPAPPEPQPVPPDSGANEGGDGNETSATP